MEPRNVSSKLSFEYFIAYLLPGVTIALGVFFLTQECGLHNYSFADINFFAGIVFLLISFVVGIVFSGISDQIMDFIYWVLGMAKPSSRLVMKELQGELIDSFRSEFNIRVRKSGWCEEHFFLVRNVVEQFMPEAAQSLHRQGGLRLIRGYLILPVILWTINGVVFSITEIGEAQHQLIMLLIILASGYFLTISLWFSMRANAAREIRYTLISFVGLSKSGILRKNAGIIQGARKDVIRANYY